MREFIIKENDADQRLDKFISKSLKTMPKSLMYKYIRNKKIKVNRKRCEISQRLQVNDLVQCYISEEFFEQIVSYDFLQVPKTLHILYEDEHILVVDKEIGLLAHKDESGIQDNLQDRILHYLYDKQAYDPLTSQSFTPALVHRIDRNTQGIVVAAKTAAALRILNEKIRDHELSKFYVCIVEGEMEAKQGEMHFYLEKNEEENKVQIQDTYQVGWQEIRSSYNVIKQKKHHSLLEVALFTGKSHQIRASLAHVHHPLLGDRKYGAKPVSDFPYQALCAYRIIFSFRSDAGILNYLKDKEILSKEIRLISYFDERC